MIIKRRVVIFTVN